MIEQSVSLRSLNEHVVESISSILYKEHWPTCEITPNGILALIDEIASYHEEGKELFPHILLTTNLNELLKAVPSVQQILIKTSELDIKNFYSSLKLCAPLALDGWIIFIDINIKEGKIAVGLLSSELSETSPSMHRQLLGDLSIESLTVPLLYISNVGQRTVLLEGPKTKVMVSLSLKTISNYSYDSIRLLAVKLAENANSEIKETLVMFFDKLLASSLKDCHGTLIGVVENSVESISNMKEHLKDGVYLEKPIDIALLIENSELEKSREASNMVRIYSGVVHNMLNFDGITIFTTDGKVLAYHCFVKQDTSQDSDGGARSRAFDAMINLNTFVFCLYKSQDGNQKIWSKQ